MPGPSVINDEEISQYDDDLDDNGEGNFGNGIPRSMSQISRSPSRMHMDDFDHNSTTSLEGPVASTEPMSLARFKMVDEAGAAKSNIITEIVFIPRNSKPITPKEVFDLITKKWKLTPANMLINCDAGSMHPKALATKKLSAQPQFNQWVEDSKAQLKSKADDTTMEKNPEELAEECNMVINSLIFQRLLTIFSAVLDAASLSNNWILINRVNSQGSSSTGELMLELAMQQTSQRPVVVVIESFNRLQRYTNDDAVEQIQLLQKLRLLALPYGSYNSSEFPVVKMTAKYGIEEFDDYRYWENLDEYPLPCDAHRADLVDGQVAPRARWGYHYQSAMFTSGTHYIVLDGDETVFPVSALGEIGNVSAHGSTRAYQRIRGVINAGRPLIMLNNTGGVTQAFASLQKAMIEAQASEETFSSEKVLKKIEIMNNIDQWTQNFGIPEIMMFRELMQRAPLLFQKTIVTVDLVKDSAEEVLSTVTACFANSSSGVPELGIGNAESAVVYNAWKRHLVLYQNCAKMKRDATGFFIVITLLGLATATMSTTYANAAVLDMGEDAKSIMNTFIILLPILSALCVSILTTQRFNEKWKICDMAGSMIVSEIYNFRAGTDIYGGAEAGEEEESDDEEDGNGANLNQATKNRNLFVKRVQGIFSKVMESDVGKSGSLVYGNVLKADTSQGIESKFHKKTLRPHVETHLIHTRIVPKRGKIEIIKKDNMTGMSEGIDPDDLISPMTIETYVEFRAKPITDWYEKSTPTWARRLSTLER